MRSCAVLLVALLPTLPAYARAAHGDAWARERFATAEHLREALNGRPPAERTRHDYQRVLDAYRRVYFGAPASTKADPSAFAVADLLMEMGRHFDDEKLLRSAVDQYGFLRREYPASKYRFDALFTVAEIYKDDLDSPAQARAAFEEFLRRYPHNAFADDARHALNEISEAQSRRDEATRQQAARRAEASRKAKNNFAKSSADNDSDNDERASSDMKRGKLSQVTGIRHWFTPDHTRVAIDLEQNVEFESQRIDHPDRIFFDLRDTRLASALMGKSFDVDDGFLKKIRIAQFRPGRTRVVLEVNNLAQYNAFVQPNPYRLIIEIRGKEGGKLAASKDVDATPKARDESKSANPRVLDEPDPEVKTSTPGTLTRLEPKSSSPPAVAPTAIAKTEASPAMDVKQTVVPGKPSPVKKIVEADDEEEDVKIVTLQPADLRPEITSAERATLAAPKAVDAGKSNRAASTRNSVADNGTESASRGARGKGKRKAAAAVADFDIREAKPTSKGDRSLIRALGLKIGKIVIDPGHGGHDTGTIGPNGLEEKDLVLGVAKRLGKLLQTRLGAEVIYTRQDDTFIPLETRTAIANQEEADLFISIHANSSGDPDARGVETYYLNFTSNPDALEVAARENAVSDKSIHELQDLVKTIALKEKIEESREFASDVQRALHSGLAARSSAVRDRGVKKAPFIVLIGANMPSILAEISFVSNPTDARKLETAEYRQRIAESLYRGISTYVGGLSGLRVASRTNSSIPVASGQSSAK